MIDPTINYLQPFGGSSLDEVQDMLLTTEGSTSVVAIIGTTWSTDYGQLQGTAPLTGVASLFVSKRNPETGAMLWHTFFGGGSSGQGTYGNAIALSPAQQLLITGSTTSPQFPHIPLTAQACSSTENVYVSKLNLLDGIVQASRCLGTAPAANVGQGIAVDSSGQVWIAGSSRAGDFLQPLGGTLRVYGLYGSTQPVPYRPSLLQGFLVKLDASLQNAQTRIYFGSYSGAQVTDLALDQQDRPVVVGDASASSSDPVLFPTTANGYQAEYSYGGNFYDAFIMQLSADGSTQTYSSWLGDVSTYDRATSVTIGKDATDSGDIYVTGSSTGSSQEGQRAFALPTTMNGLAWETIRGSNQAAFVVRMRPSATTRSVSLVYGSLLRATSNPQYIIDTYAIAARNGVAYMVGTTQQADLLVDPAQTYQSNGDAYLSALDTTQRAMPLSSYLGATGTDSGRAVQVRSDGSVLVGGNLNAYTTSANAYIARISPTNLQAQTMTLQITDANGQTVQGLTTNADGWPMLNASGSGALANPLTVTALVSNASTQPQDMHVQFTIGNAAPTFNPSHRFYVINGPACISSHLPSPFYYSTYQADCTLTTVSPAQYRTLIWHVWVQPSVQQILPFGLKIFDQANQVTAQAQHTLNVEQGSIRPVIIIPGFLGSYIKNGQ